MRILKNGLKYISVFLITVIILTGLLVLVACIPQQAIKENTARSAEYLCSRGLFDTIIDNTEGSRIDRYADSILLGIIYQQDAQHPLQSVMMSSYYYNAHVNENENLYNAVTNNLAANQQYMRYWHGSSVLVKPLLTVMNLKQIYVVNGILIAFLTVMLFLMLLKIRAYIPLTGLVIGYGAIAIWFAPLSLEYTWMFLLMPVISMVSIHIARKGNLNNAGILFLISGIVTNYFDFLTTETVTLLIPLLLMLWNCTKTDTNFRHLLNISVKSALSWGCGYCGMWITKWLLASAIMHKNMLPYVTGHIDERLSGDIGLSTGAYIKGALLKNIACMFPLGYGTIGVIAAVMICIAAIYLGYIYHKNKVNMACIGIYLMLGIIPYVRYIVLHNHSYLHCFFTYRAQLSSILALTMILGEIIDWRYFAHGKIFKRS